MQNNIDVVAMKAGKLILPDLSIINRYNFILYGSSDSYEDSLKNIKVCRRTSLPKNSVFRRSMQLNAVGSRGIRHSFSGT